MFSSSSPVLSQQRNEKGRKNAKTFRNWKFISRHCSDSELMRVWEECVRMLSCAISRFWRLLKLPWGSHFSASWSAFVGIFIRQSLRFKTPQCRCKNCYKCLKNCGSVCIQQNCQQTGRGLCVCVCALSNNWGTLYISKVFSKNDSKRNSVSNAGSLKVHSLKMTVDVINQLQIDVTSFWTRLQSPWDGWDMQNGVYMAHKYFLRPQ